MGAVPYDKSTLTAEEKTVLLEDRDALLNSLLDLIRGNTMQFSKLAPKTKLKTVACSAIYIPGSFGFIGRQPLEHMSEVVDAEVEKSELSLKESKSLAVQTKESLAAEQGDKSTEATTGMDDKEPKSTDEKHVEVIPIELKGTSIIREGSIITHSSSFMQEISSAMIKHTESEEFEETDKISDEQLKSLEVSQTEPELPIDSEEGPAIDSGPQSEAIEISEVPSTLKEKSRVTFHQDSKDTDKAAEKSPES